jgi:hypothetical protein
LDVDGTTAVLLAVRILLRVWGVVRERRRARSSPCAARRVVVRKRVDARATLRAARGGRDGS